MPDPRPVPTLADLLDAPERALDLDPVEAARLLATVGALEAVLRARVAAPERNGDGAEAAMLSVEQAAGIAGVTVEAFYRRKAFRSSIVKLGHRTRRVNERKLRRILAAMEP